MAKDLETNGKAMPCFAHSKESSVKGKECPFVHRAPTEDELVKKGEWTERHDKGKGKGSGKQVPICIHFVKGNCSRGN